MTCRREFQPFVWQTVLTPTNPPMAMTGWITRCKCCEMPPFTVIKDQGATEISKPWLRVGKHVFVRLPGKWLPRLWLKPCKRCGHGAATHGKLCVQCHKERFALPDRVLDFYHHGPSAADACTSN